MTKKEWKFKLSHEQNSFFRHKFTNLSKIDWIFWAWFYIYFFKPCFTPSAFWISSLFSVASLLKFLAALFVIDLIWDKQNANSSRFRLSGDLMIRRVICSNNASKCLSFSMYCRRYSSAVLKWSSAFSFWSGCCLVCGSVNREMEKMVDKK